MTRAAMNARLAIAAALAMSAASYPLGMRRYYEPPAEALPPTDADLDRLAKAQAKRDRKAAKRVAKGEQS